MSHTVSPICQKLILFFTPNPSPTAVEAAEAPTLALALDEDGANLQMSSVQIVKHKIVGASGRHGGALEGEGSPLARKWSALAELVECG